MRREEDPRLSKCPFLSHPLPPPLTHRAKEDGEERLQDAVGDGADRPQHDQDLVLKEDGGEEGGEDRSGAVDSVIDRSSAKGNKRKRKSVQRQEWVGVSLRKER